MRKLTYFPVILSLFLGFIPCITAAQSHYGTHGMILFGGKDALFASHLPMYHPPHNVQMIIQFHFKDLETDNIVKQQLEQLALTPSQLWTIVPEPFDLMRLQSAKSKQSSPLTEFRVDVVKGHFERGGSSQFNGQSIVIEKVLFFKILDMEKGLTKAENTQYISVSANQNSANQFLIKQLGKRPEADHLVRVVNHALPVMVTVKQATSVSPSISALASALSTDSENLIEIYLETKELE
ncbi:hypothetical protein [Shewanella sp. 10N.286.54.B9]|uniref:hypothetical protein n=1 Tax=Shewanella sp. 10N.286.54.B9 TaxID=3229719 RepID=UPI00354E782B